MFSGKHTYGSKSQWIILVLLTLSIYSSQGFAAPALDKTFQLKQPNGAKFKARQGGDEWFNWIEHKGYIIGKDEKGNWRYKESADKGKSFGLSKKKVGIDGKPSGAVSVSSFAQTAPTRPAEAPEIGLSSDLPSQGPSLPEEPILVLLVSFSDIGFITSSSDWQNSMFGTSGKSVRTYYNEVSNGTFRFVGAPDSEGASDGVVRVTLGYPHPNTSSSTGDPNRILVKDALIAADPYVNFAAFDKDSNGGLSVNELHIVTIVAGYERAYTSEFSPSVWGHRWALGWGAAPAPILDGVAVGGKTHGGGYTQQGERHGDHQSTIGVICHELGHDIGLPDLYDTNSGNGSSSGIGVFGLMSTGTWGYGQGEYSGASPTHFCAWSKVAMGLVDAAEISGNGTYTIHESSRYDSNIIKISTSDPSEYFLVENRQKTGFDEGLHKGYSEAGGGLAIWHVDTDITSHYPVANDVNADETHKGVDMEEASGWNEMDDNLNWGKRYHLWYSGNQIHFGEHTTPNSRLYNGTSTGIDISNVSASGSSMTCYISVPGGGSVATSTPTRTPTATPTKTPTHTFTHTATIVPTQTPTWTFTPVNTPTNTPTDIPQATNTPTNTPTDVPQATYTPTNTPTHTYSATPTHTNSPLPTPTVDTFQAPHIVYVNKFGTDNGYDSFTSIQGALDVVMADGTVFILPGVYEEQAFVVGKPMKIVGIGGPVLRGTGSGTGITILMRDVTVCYLRIEQFSTGIHVGNSQNVRIHDCNILNNTDYGVRNTDAGNITDAANNWWGRESGPLNTAAYVSGSGDKVSLGVETNPYLSTFCLIDSDGDGLCNGTEDLNGNGMYDIGETDLYSKDTDGDSAEDGIEMVLGSSPTDPNSVPDNVPGTMDSDGDGFSDFYEVLSGSDPNDPLSRPELGDIDDNGRLNNIDALLMMNISLSNLEMRDFNPNLMDMDRNGLVDYRDALILFNFVLGNVSVLPIQ